MNELRDEIFEILSKRFGKAAVLLDYPCEKSIEGLILSSEFESGTPTENCEKIYECLSQLPEEKMKSISLMLPITYAEIDEQDVGDENKEAKLMIAREVVDGIVGELGLKCIESKVQSVTYEEFVVRLRASCSRKKMLSTYTKAAAALILYGYGFENVE